MNGSVASGRGRAVAVAVVVAVLAGLVVVAPGMLGREEARAVGSYSNASIADIALGFVGRWGGEACGGTGYTKSGQCKQFVNCVVARASGGTQRPTGSRGDYVRSFTDAGGVEIVESQATKGDIIQWGSETTLPLGKLHTAIVVENQGGGWFRVVDSNFSLNEKVQDHVMNVHSTLRGYPAPRFVRMGTVTAPPPPDRDGDGTPDAQDRCIDQGGPSSNRGCPQIVVMRQGGVVWGKAGLNDTWIKLATWGRNLMVDGQRIATLHAGDLWAKDGLGGAWYKLAGDVEEAAVSSDLVVMRQGGVVWGKAGLNDTWIKLATWGRNVMVDGQRIATLHAGDLWAKDGLGGAWFKLAGGVDEAVINTRQRRAIGVPHAPKSVVGQPGDQRVVVSWSVPASDGGAPITGYRVTSSPGGRACATGGATSCTVTGLANGTGYTFTVTAANTAGVSAPSAPSPRVTPRVAVLVTVSRAGYGNLLGVDVDPDRGASGYAFWVQKRSSGGTWRTLPTTYRTDGATETKKVTLGAGVFRVQVPAAAGHGPAISGPVTLTKPTVRVVTTADPARDRLLVDVDPDRGGSYWTFKVRKRTAAGAWSTLATTHRTGGRAETKTLNLPAGTYRVTVAARHGYLGATSTSTTLTR